MEGSGSTWRPGTGREIGGSSSGDTHGAATKSGDGAEYKTQRVLGILKKKKNQTKNVRLL